MAERMHWMSPLGGITLAGGGDGLLGLWFDGQRFFAAGLPEGTPERETPLLRETVRWLEIYFSGRDPGFTPPLAPRGTPFQRAVWAELTRIPRGETRSYGEVARSLGLPASAARAAGGAVARNPVSLIIPCHRVIAADGSLGGYAGGLARKKSLLALEQA